MDASAKPKPRSVLQTIKQSASKYMHKIRRRSALAFVSALQIGCGHGNADVTIANNAHEAISGVSVTMCGQRIEAHNLAVGATTKGRMRISCEGDYDVAVTFDSGRQLRATTGYVTSGVDISAEISITDSKVTLNGVNTSFKAK